VPRLTNRRPLKVVGQQEIMTGKTGRPIEGRQRLPSLNKFRIKKSGASRAAVIVDRRRTRFFQGV
jgi:hypothetical protein